MKITRTVAWALTVSGVAFLGLASGCAYNEPLPPPGVAVVGFVPDYCFWDGFEYVGWYGGAFYYRGFGGDWFPCDPVRRRRAHVWVSEHPHWRTQATSYARPAYPSDANESSRLLPPQHPEHPEHPPRGRDHVHDHGHHGNRHWDRDRGHDDD